MKFSVNNKSIILIGMNIFLLSILLWQFYPSSNDRTQSHYVTSRAIGIAISKIQYGLDKGYAGYHEVFFMFLTAFIMLLMASPHYSTIMDPAFTMTTIMYIGISISFYYIWRFILMTKKMIN